MLDVARQILTVIIIIVTVYCAATYNGTFSVQKKSIYELCSCSVYAAVTGPAGDKLWQEFFTTAITILHDDKL